MDTALAEAETIVSARISLALYCAVRDRAERWGLLQGAGRPNLSATLRRLIEAGLEVTNNEGAGEEDDNGQ